MKRNNKNITSFSIPRALCDMEHSISHSFSEHVRFAILYDAITREGEELGDLGVFEDMNDDLIIKTVNLNKIQKTYLDNLVVSYSKKLKKEVSRSCVLKKILCQFNEILPGLCEQHQPLPESETPTFEPPRRHFCCPICHASYKTRRAAYAHFHSFHRGDEYTLRRPFDRELDNFNITLADFQK